MSLNLHERDLTRYRPSDPSYNIGQFIKPLKDPKDHEKSRLCVQRLFIDSRNRDTSLDYQGGPFSFVIYLDDPNQPQSVGIPAYELVHSVELKAFNMPKVAGEHYVVLDIAELANQIDSNDDASNGKFTIAFFDGYDSVNPSSGMQPGDVKVIKGADVYQRIVKFQPAIARMNRLTVAVRKYGGDVVQPTDCGGVEYCTFLLEITTESRSIH